MGKLESWIRDPEILLQEHSINSPLHYPQEKVEPFIKVTVYWRKEYADFSEMPGAGYESTVIPAVLKLSLA